MKEPTNRSSRGTCLGRSQDAVPLITEGRAGEARRPLLRAAAQATGLTDGTNGPLVYAFIDLSCPFCAMLYWQLKPFIAQGRIRVHWIPVAVLTQSSRRLAAAVLEADDPSAALAAYEAGGLAIRGDVTLRVFSARISRALDANNRLLALVNDGATATPILLFRRRDGAIDRHAGALKQPSDLLAVLPSD